MTSRATPRERTIWDRARRCRRRCAARLEDYPMPSPDAARAPARWTTRRGAASCEPGLRQRRRRAGRPQGRAAAGRHDGAVRRRSTTRPGCSSASEYAQAIPVLGADPRRRIPTISMRFCARDRAFVARARGRSRSRRSARPRDLAPRVARTSVPTSRCTTRAARTGRERCRCWSVVIAESRARAGCSKRSPRPRASGARLPKRWTLRQQNLQAAAPSAAELVAAGSTRDERAADTRGDRRLRIRARRDPGRGVRARSGAGRALPRRAPAFRGAARARSRAARRATIRWRSSSAHRSVCC